MILLLLCILQDLTEKFLLHFSVWWVLYLPFCLTSYWGNVYKEKKHPSILPSKIFCKIMLKLKKCWLEGISEGCKVQFPDAWSSIAAYCIPAENVQKNPENLQGIKIPQTLCVTFFSAALLPLVKKAIPKVQISFRCLFLILTSITYTVIFFTCLSVGENELKKKKKDIAFTFSGSSVKWIFRTSNIYGLALNLRMVAGLVLTIHVGWSKMVQQHH